MAQYIRMAYVLTLEDLREAYAEGYEDGFKDGYDDGVNDGTLAVTDANDG